MSLNSPLDEPEKTSDSKPFLEATIDKPVLVAAEAQLNDRAFEHSFDTPSFESPDIRKKAPSEVLPETVDQPTGKETRTPSISEEVEATKKLPNLIFGLPIILLVSAFLTQYVFDTVSPYNFYYGWKSVWSIPGLAWLNPGWTAPYSRLIADFIGNLPVCGYWIFCIHRLSLSASIKFKDKLPLTNMFLFALFLGSLFITPLITLLRAVPHWNSLPFFLFWLITQLSWPFLLSKYIQQKTNSDSSWSQKKAVFSTLLTNGLLFIAPSWDPLYLGFPFYWLTSQLLGINYFKKMLSSASSRKSNKSKERDYVSFRTGKDIIIRFRPFAAIERWRQQQEGALKKEMKIILAISVVMFFLTYSAVISFLKRPEANAIVRISLGQPLSDNMKSTLRWSELYPAIKMVLVATGRADEIDIDSVTKNSNDAKLSDSSSNSSNGTGKKKKLQFGELNDIEGVFNLQFVNALGAAIACLMIGGFVYILSKPSHIGLSRHGWRFLWRGQFRTRDGSYLPWNELSEIKMVNPKGKTSGTDAQLHFTLKNGTKTTLSMGSIDSVEDRETFLKAIQKWAPNASKDPTVIQALQPPADHSYTELWMQALSAPPKRERLKPLIGGTSLKQGSFRIMSQIGTGGQGQAYLAEDTGSGAHVVLKEFILPVFVDVNVRRSALEQFENEARILRQLDHPQIVKLIDFFIEDHRSYLVLEHIKGSSLQDLVRKQGKLPEQTVRELASQMCDILGYLHGLQPPVVHRDFTPDNLILNSDGRLKLIDFNVAKKVVESTTSGTVVGKHAYLPPEQFRGMPECASDIYSMGGTLHFLLTGADPEPITVSRPKRTIPELSDAINSLIEKCTALDSKKRYESPHHLRKDLSDNA